MNKGKLRIGGGGWTRTNDLRPGTALLSRLRKAETVALRGGNQEDVAMQRLYVKILEKREDIGRWRHCALLNDEFQE